MTVLPNGTDAKDIAIHFINVTTGKATPSIIAKTIKQAKNLLNYGYTKEEIISVIDYLITKKHIDLYSLGYVNTSINNILRDIKKNKPKPTSQHTFQAYQEKNEVMTDESTNRNKSKLNRFGVQSRFGTESLVDMFEKQ